MSKSNTQQRAAARRTRKLINTIIEREGTHTAEAVRDLLTDIRHFCDRSSIKFEEVCGASYQVYLEERAGG